MQIYSQQLFLRKVLEQSSRWYETIEIWWLLLLRLFPNANIITELSQASNMRFMQFRANKDSMSENIARLEQVCALRVSIIK